MVVVVRAGVLKRGAVLEAEEVNENRLKTRRKILRRRCRERDLKRKDTEGGGK